MKLVAPKLSVDKLAKDRIEQDKRLVELGQLGFVNKERLKQTNPDVLTAIENAWNENVYTDERSRPYLAKEVLHIVWRTDKPNANEIYINIYDEYKKKIDGINCLAFSAVIQVLFEKSFSTPDLNQEAYLEYSFNLCAAIAWSNEQIINRTAYNQYVKGELQRLKYKRGKFLAKKAGVQFCDMRFVDELTGEKLDYTTCHFSHIIGKAARPDLAIFIENGLLVSPETHKIITKKGVLNDDGLLSLCKKLEWNTDWYNDFKQFKEKISLRF